MHIRNVRWRGRRAWELDNDELRLTLLPGGGHFASVVWKERPRINPYWTPVWRTVDPWQYRPRPGADAERRLLASICGHNPCLGFFGLPSPAEQAAGLGCHGEAPVARWRLLGGRCGRQALRLTCACELPAAQMRYTRTVTARRGERCFRVREEIRNLARRDTPFTMCQHVTLGPPFLEKGVTLFDLAARRGHTFPGAFSGRQRLKPDTAFRWPRGPGARGETVDLRQIGREYRVSSDFSAQLLDPAREEGWFSALNPRLGLLLAYVWRRADFPWLGNWEENYARRQAPWAGRSLTRGMEFATSPFPEPLRAAVERGTFYGLPTYRWLPAREALTFEYAIVFTPAPPDAQGVSDIRSEGARVRITLR